MPDSFGSDFTARYKSLWNHATGREFVPEDLTPLYVTGKLFGSLGPSAASSAPEPANFSQTEMVLATSPLMGKRQTCAPE